MREINGQELVEQMVKKELLRLKKICFKYQHRPLLQNKLEIVVTDLTEIKASGLYNKINNGKNPLNYHHKISINTKDVNEYINCKYDNYGTKSYLKRYLKKIITHEICHAPAVEMFGDWTTIEGAENDASPIFLSLLYWLDGFSNHKCVKAYKKSDMYKEVKNIETFDLLDKYLTCKVLEYEKVVRNLHVKSNPENYIINSFTFSHRGAGLVASTSATDFVIDTNTRKSLNLACNNYEIGSSVLPSEIERLVNKKEKNNNFVRYSEKVSYLKDNYMCTIKDGKLNKVKIQSESIAS